MTREEAIQILTRERDEDIFGGYTLHRKKIHEAETMAIEALKREPSEDLISRAEVTEIFEAMLKTVTDQKIKIGISRSWQQIKDLPSADRPRPIEPTITVDLESGVVPISACEPKAPKTIIYADRIYTDRPKGRWHYSDGKPATIGQSFGVICDQCGTKSEYCTNFCGECGADMRETKGAE